MSTAARAGDLRNYALVTAAYWADTITDGAIRILVLFYFYDLGYSPLEVASLFLFYEAFGILTNLFGGWIAARFGLKSTLLGGLLLTVVGFQPALGILAVFVGAALLLVLVAVHGELGRPDAKARFRHMFSHNRAVNLLAAARIFLFASRDVWFVVGLPVFLRSVLGWSFWEVGTFMAVWVIGYGIVQAFAPRLLRRHGEPTGPTAAWLAFALALLPAGIAIALAVDFDPTIVLVVGLIIFGAVFALNSAVHSFLILHYADGDKVAMNVGFYYMANAGGRLAGTILSGLLYQWQGLEACLWASAVMVLAAGAISLMLPRGARGAGVARP